MTADPLRTGKLSSNLLQTVVLNRTGVRRREVRVRAGIGMDCAVLDFEGDLIVLSTDPITGAAGDAGYWAIHICCNDVAVFGAEPIALLLTLLLPESASASDLADLTAGAHQAAVELGIEIVGGHTEITPAVNGTVLSATAVGRVKADKLVTPAGARPGDLLVLTKGAGIEGTAILAEAFGERLLAAGLSPETIACAKAMRTEIGVLADARVALEHSPTAMHDPTEGGVLGAVFELAEASGLGFVIRAADVPVRPQTQALAEILGFDPLQLISSGALLAAAAPETAAGMVEALRRAGIAAAIIGELTPPDQGRWVIDGAGRQTPVIDTPRDELWRMLHDHN